MTRPRVLFATAEFAPLSFVGGLASASAGLVHTLRARGHDVTVVHPDYSNDLLQDESTFEVEVPLWAAPARCRVGVHDGAGPVTLVSVPGIHRPHPYLTADGSGWPDNDLRFLAFSQAVAALTQRLTPDVLHLNDWHTAAALAALSEPPPSVLSIHNLAYQGQCEHAWVGRLGPRSEPYNAGTHCNPLAGGLALADAIVAVSPTYAHEIQTPELGCGLDGLLRSRSAAVVGIRNGIETDVWDPAADPLLERRFTIDDLAARAENRSALRAELGLPGYGGPLAVVVSRLVPQKGIDLLLPLLAGLPALGVQVAILGSGDRDLADALRAAASATPEWVAFVEGFDLGLSHRLLGGGDLLLMPSRFEPCGLTQMQAMRYGAVPVVTGVGGLRDTVGDADLHPGTGTGFVADAVTSDALRDALVRAVTAFSDSARWDVVQRRGMERDWSWDEPGAEYAQIYDRLANTGTVRVR